MPGYRGDYFKTAAWYSAGFPICAVKVFYNWGMSGVVGTAALMAIIIDMFHHVSYHDE